MSLIQDLLDARDPVVRTHPFIGSLYIVPLIVISYAIFVLKLGPYFMRNRAPFKLKAWIIGYNILQIFANLLVFICIILSIELGVCTGIETGTGELALFRLNVQYGFLFLKLIDLIDTVFFVLRKKYNQVSFVHVYHHIAMTITPWLYTNYYRWGQSTWVGLLNAPIHVIMYAYYLFTIWKPESAKNLWWKKYLTQIQMVQHSCLALTGLLSVMSPDCTSPKVFDFLNFVQAVIMFKLFWDFYVKAYLTKKDT